MSSHAKAYEDPGTPEEQSRRQFMANATLAIGGVIGLVVAIPCAASLIPESLVKPGASGGVPTPLSADDVKTLEAATKTPAKITFSFQYADGYLPAAPDEVSVWGIKLSPEQREQFKAERPDLFDVKSHEVGYPAAIGAIGGEVGFVIFSSICPHLGCHYEWHADVSRFFCPCHGSQFSILGKKLAGPAPRGLDPLPLTEKNGKANVTWIQYKSGLPDRIVVAYN